MVANLEFLELVRKGVRAFRGHILKPMTDSEHAGDLSCLPPSLRCNRQSRLKGVWTWWAKTPGIELLSLFIFFPACSGKSTGSACLAHSWAPGA